MPVVCGLCDEPLNEDMMYLWRPYNPEAYSEKLQALLSVIGHVSVCKECYYDKSIKYDWVDEPSPPTECPDCGSGLVEKDGMENVYRCIGCPTQVLWRI